MKRKAIALIMAAAMIFTGCGSSKTETANTPEAASAAQETDGAASAAAQETAGEADPYGKYEEPVTFTVAMSVDPNEVFPEGDSYTDNQYTRYIKEQLNVDVEFLFTASTSDWDTKVNLAITSNQIPDAMVVNATQFNQMYRAGQLADLTDVYDQYASDTMKSMVNSSNGLAIENVSYKDRMYGLTSTSDGDYELTWIRKDWLDKLNLEPPKTCEELEAVAKAFVENDVSGKGTIGFAGPQSGGLVNATFLNNGTNNYGFDSYFNGFGAYPGWWLIGEDGKPVYGSITPETRNALEKLASWYKDGLIDPEMGIRQDASEPIVAGKTGIFSGGWWMGYACLPDVIANNPEANFQAYAIPVNDTNGKYTPHASGASYAYLVVSKDCEHPEIAVKLNNLLIRDEGTFDTSQGGIGNFPCRIAFGMQDESVFTVNAMRDVLAGTKTVDDFTEEDFTLYKLLKNDLETISTVKKEPYDSMDIGTWDVQANPGAWARDYSLMVGWGALIDSQLEPVYSAIYQQTETMEQRWANLEKMENETFMKIIMNQEPIEAFDTFVENWKAQGGDIITEEVTEFYNSKQ